MQDKVAGMIGLAARAGKVASGEFSVEKAVKSKHARLVIIAEDASDTTKKNFTDMCRFYETKLYFRSTKEQLGHMIGREYRASLAITNAEFAKAIIAKIEQEN